MSAATISTIIDPLMILLCNSNVGAALSIVSIISTDEPATAIISLLFESIRWETDKITSPLGEIVSSTPWNRSRSLV